ncbi:N-alpha-acetyltransferase 50 [Echinococcus granulosus]|uniref:N-terminal methionine N(alpha)-acetyltransferase NatE n=1 Tax=Echinococcus granulosus TaxID=6210 RepID=U6JE19_ECHGR|nr:N-acetyltransferase NAT13 [Echinococcus granulosus]EUB62080.1 N-acetyltransferase NAT13 [Echinococcus granulosus]KAH9285154.1 N-alpha-acetyltransferase 50 [Echinococcus granulosus]CDS19969.1 n alpha acetyltransferase 50 NatE catalytic [Echinococcus granulosus]
MTSAEPSINGSVTRLRKADDVRIELGELTVHNVNQLKIINRTVFPVHYTDKFYTDLLKQPQLCRLAYFNDIVVGAVCYRYEKVDGSDNLKKCYIMTLGCLAPYRRYGVGSLLLRHVLRKCTKNKQVKSIYLHVHIENDAAVRFYEKFDFQITRKIENYYHRLSPQDAYILEKQLDHSVPVSDSDSD